MSKITLIIICKASLLLHAYSSAQNLPVQKSYGDTIMFNINAFYKKWEKEDIKYVEVFSKKDSTLICSYSTYKNKLYGIRSLYNSNGRLSSSENFIDGQLTGTAKEYYWNGNVRAEGKYEFTRGRGSFKDSVCIESSFGVGDISCYVQNYPSPKVGKWIYYSNNGKKYMEGSYADNNRVGTWTIYDPRTGKEKQNIYYPKITDK
ncbi:hypothetical protein RCC89_06420 [Cytophagaceae bacterium ABcell3]|nr:hypothetical protein RCC89_06420 [Cytophagaceae bacterium ABcell3]